MGGTGDGEKTTGGGGGGGRGGSGGSGGGGAVHDTTGLSSAPPRHVVSRADTSWEGRGPKRSSRMPRCLSSALMLSSVTEPSGDV